MLDKEWFSTDDLAGLRLPGMPGTKRNVQRLADAEGWTRSDYKNKYWRMRAGRGGGVEFHYTLLSIAAQAKITIAFMAAEDAARSRTAKAEIGRDEAAMRFENLPQKQKDQALFRLNAIQAVDDLHMTGVGLCEARAQVGKILDIAPSSISGWEARVQHVAACDRRYFLASHHAGRAESAECHPDAWEFLKTDYLRLSQPTFEKCYRDLKAVAAKEGWPIPSARTLQRRIDALPEGLKVLAREGQEAIKRIFPAQERDRSVFHALQAVNADGHKFDVFVKWHDGAIARIMMVAFQDLYSGKILSYRLDRSENKDAVRLAFGDLVEQYGIPDECLLDNGRAFASKWMSGGVGNRYRFKVKDEDPDGIMKQLGVTVHWATPYHGQSKPIERGFRDFANDIAKDIRFEGAYTGNNPVSKPENYGSKAVPFDLFAKVVAQGVAEHNARADRKAKVCAGRSFDETFAESYAKAPIRKATTEQRRLWLLAAEGIMAAKVDGSLRLLGNRYWSAFLHEHRGQKLVMRFDPQALHQDMHVYRLDGAYLGAAACIEAVGFFDTDKAREHAQNRGAFVKATKAARDAVMKMSLSDAAKLVPEAEEPGVPEAKVVRPIFPTRGSAALKPIQQEDDDPREAEMAAGLRQMNRALRGQVHLLVVPEDDDD